MRYVLARYKKELREEIYRIYVTDIMQGFISAFLEGDIPRYYDLFNIFGENPENEENLNPEDIINRIRDKVQS